MIKKKSSAKNGFTLIETILVIIVLAISSYGVLSVFINGLKESASPLQGVQAIELAKEKLEIIIADKHDTSKGYAYIVSGNYPAETPVSGFSEFNRSVTLQEIDALDLATASPGSGYLKVTVTVSWSSGSISLDSLVADY
ncbi:prepilin-type N-terminal cleavage/methylation domain-containing protein [Thermodesulfobacteriota bacterium]